MKRATIITAILLTGLAGFFVPTAQTGNPSFAFVLSQRDIQQPVEQESPNFASYPCNQGYGTGCDPSSWVTNPLSPCLWDVDDFASYHGQSGTIDKGTTASVSQCGVSDGHQEYSGDVKSIQVDVFAPVNTLSVSLTNDQGGSFQIAPMANGNRYEYLACIPNPLFFPNSSYYPPIAGSNGGTGVPVTWTLSLTAPASRAVRDVNAVFQIVGFGRSNFYVPCPA